MHLKRPLMPVSWPIERKGTTYVVRPNSNLEFGIPLLIVLRDMLKITQTQKETKTALYQGLVLLNHRKVKSEKQSVGLFDVITLSHSKKNYRLVLSEKGKMALEDISESDAKKKVSKVIDKTMLKGKKLQLNLFDGRNYLSNVECKTNDSVVIGLDSGKIEKCLPLKNGAKIIIFDGKHAGKKGTIENIDNETKMAELSIGKEKVNALIKQMMVVEK